MKFNFFYFISDTILQTNILENKNEKNNNNAGCHEYGIHSKKPKNEKKNI